jgi:MFS family permease
MTDTTATTARASAAKAVLITLAAAQFVMVLDASVMNVSIATVAKDLGTTVTGIQTAITMYTLVMASLMITGGRMGAILGRKRAFKIGCVIYACGSLITSVSPNLAVLMFGWSFLEGVGAALVMPAIVALVASNFDKPARPRAYGVVAAGGAIAVGVGPLIGGLFITYWSWRYVFVGEALVIGVVLLLNRRTADTPKEEGARLDLVGTALSALGLGLIVYGVLRSGTWGIVQPKPHGPTWLGLSPVIWLLLGGGVVLLGFLAWEKHRRDTGPARAARPCDPQGPPAAQRAHRLLLPVFAPGRAVLRSTAVPLDRARPLGDRDRRAHPAALDHPGDRRDRHPPRVPEGVAPTGLATRVRPAVPRSRRVHGRPRRGCRPRGHDLADAPRRVRDRRARVPARRGDGLGPARRAER